MFTLSNLNVLLSSIIVIKYDVIKSLSIVIKNGDMYSNILFSSPSIFNIVLYPFFSFIVYFGTLTGFPFSYTKLPSESTELTISSAGLINVA